MLSWSYFQLVLFAGIFTAAVMIQTEATFKRLHPFLFFDEEDIPDLRKRAESTHAEIANRISRVAQEITRKPERYLPPKDWQKFASAWNEGYGNNLCAIAFYCVLNEHDLTARELALQFMDRLENLPNWRVAASLRDDVPVAHSLIGMATAYDFMYAVMNDTQRIRFLEKITAVTKELYVRSYDKSTWWGTSYIQNHVATNYMALFTGALVVARHKNVEAEKWVSRAHLMLGRNLELLNLVVDGSISEGVAYGTYTSRSLTQYVFLALRHFQTDFTHSPWLKEHYWFLHYTVLPGFKETVGIGDSNRNWFYGPESQLVFLDNYVLKNGLGNWLARQIREHTVLKGPLSQAWSHRNCMLHTEFVFYNASIKERALPNPNLPRLHVFSDWGVVTYGGGRGSLYPKNNSRTPLAERGTFLSFKCGVLHGRAINSVVRKKGFHSWLSSWKNFNPGHEQPDQGSFVFAPNGVPFVTETYYGPKYTWLNNAIVFGPSTNSKCSCPYEGQTGECNHWFNFKNMSAWRAEGEVITASADRNMVFISGEMSKWYRPGLGLLSVYRTVILLTPTVLLVVDHVERKKESEDLRMSAFFHNVDNPFKLDGRPSRRSSHASVSINGLVHKVHWSSSHKGGDSIVRAQDYVSDFKGLKTNYLNVTTPLRTRITRASYLFSGPGNEVERPQVVQSSDHGTKLSVAINGERYTVSIATRHYLPYSRFKFLGFGGYGKVQIGKTETVRFGLDVISASAPDTSGTIPRGEVPRGEGATSFWYFLGSVSLSLSALFILFFLCYKLRRKFWGHLIFQAIFLCLGVLWFITTVAIHLHLCVGKSCSGNDSGETVFLKGQSLLSDSEKRPPFLVYTSLPLAGAEIVEQLFKSNADFFNVHATDNPFDDFSSTSQLTQKFLNPCTLFSRFLPSLKTAQFVKWLRMLVKDPKTVIPDLLKKSQKPLPSVRLLDPGWAMKLPWLRKVLEPSMRAVVVVRDPRGWVNAWLREIRVDPTLREAVSETSNALRNQKCHDKNTSHFAPEFRAMQEAFLEHGNAMNEDTVLFLSHLWKNHVSAVLRVNNVLPKDRIHFVLFEDLLLKPRKTAQRLFQFLDLPLPPAVEHRILQVVRTGLFSLGVSRQVVSSRMVTNWDKELSPEQANQITDICAGVMRKLRYDVEY